MDTSTNIEGWVGWGIQTDPPMVMASRQSSTGEWEEALFPAEGEWKQVYDEIDSLNQSGETKEVGDVPGLMHSVNNQKRCDQCKYVRHIQDKWWCQMYDFPTADDWTCDEWAAPDGTSPDEPPAHVKEEKKPDWELMVAALKAAQAPVNVLPPEQSIQVMPPVIHIALPEMKPQITVEAPSVNVEVPPQAPPVVTVESAPANVTVNVPPQEPPVVNVKVESQKDSTMEVIRDADGNIVEVKKRVVE